jgi:hypothetical protein
LTLRICDAIWRQVFVGKHLAAIFFSEQDSRGFEDPTFVKLRKTAVFCQCTAVTRNFKKRETGCVLADREHSRIIEPEQQEGLNGAAVAASDERGR